MIVLGRYEGERPIRLTLRGRTRADTRSVSVDFDPRKEIGGYADLKILGHFQDECLRGGPVRRWVPRALADQPKSHAGSVPERGRGWLEQPPPPVWNDRVGRGTNAGTATRNLRIPLLLVSAGVAVRSNQALTNLTLRLPPE